MKPKLIRYGVGMIKAYKEQGFSPKKLNWKAMAQPFKVMIHPVNGFGDMKYEKNPSVSVACIILLLWFVSRIISFVETGFLFNTARPEDLDLKLLFMGTVAVALFWIIANWAVTTLIDGEGNFKEIFVYTCYAMLPQVITIIPATVISKVLISNESVFLSIISTVAFCWTLLLLFLGNMIIHQFSFKKNLFSVLLTVCGILILLLVFVLGVSLVLQIESFITTVYSELFHRI